MQPKKIRADFSLTCTSFDGVDLIKEAMLMAKHQINSKEWQLSFNIIAPPNYKVEVITHKR
jgi:translation initiation factor 2 alpha subunit (eIF-2alpha)